MWSVGTLGPCHLDSLNVSQYLKIPPILSNSLRWGYESIRALDSSQGELIQSERLPRLG